MTEPAWARKAKTAAAVVFLVLVGFLVWLVLFILVSEISPLAAQIGSVITVLGALVGVGFLVRAFVRRNR